MKVQIVGSGTGTSALGALRSVLDGADEAVLCSAFVRRAGVNLLEAQLRELGDQGRIVTTTVFGGETTITALNATLDFRTRVRVYNPGRGTYHPKLYVSRRGPSTTALVCSANVTHGLVSNVEVGALISGRHDEGPLRDAWRAATSFWDATDATPWTALAAEGTDERFSPSLLQGIQHAVDQDPVFLTLASRKPNRVVEVTRGGIWVETDATRRKGTPPQEIPAWMFELAWEYLQSHGRLTNSHLVATDGLNVKRSSAVCAILARVPGVRVASRSPITLELADRSSGWSGRRWSGHD